MRPIDFIEILKMFGIPALLSGALLAYCRSVLKAVKAVKAGMQAMLRAQMISDYNKWNERNFAPIYARENFENCWEQYHNLGANGVMDDIHKKFLALPTEPPEDEE